jgi:hypothetical protein
MNVKTDVEDLVVAVAGRAKAEERVRIIDLINANPEAPEGINYRYFLIRLIADLPDNE